MSSLTSEERPYLFAGGNWTELDREDIYSGVVALESVRKGFFLGELNKLTCCAADIGNAFLYGVTREKVYMVAGPEFGELQGRNLIIVKALYGLRSSAARFHEHLAAKRRKMGYHASKADQDLWMKDMGDHYFYIACYIDDVLAWDRDPMRVMKELQEQYVLKGVGIPEYYLGGNVDMLDEHWTQENVGMALSARTYIENVIPKFETLLGGEFKAHNTPMDENLHPEMDDSPFCSQDDAAKYRFMLGSANWIATLGRYDINYSTSALS